MRERAGPIALVACLLAVVAGFGYLAGHGHAKAPPPEPLLPASGANASVEYPPASGWQAATEPLGVAGLTFGQPLVLGPHGVAARAGLIAGTLSGTASSPLPASFLAQLHGLPQTEVVGLANTEAYRYTGIQTATTVYTLYVIPSSAAVEEGVACYAPRTESSAMRTCEAIASTVTVTYVNGAAEVTNLTPEPSYAHQVGAAIGKVNALRDAVGGLGQHAAASTIARVASQVAAGFSAAHASLAPVQPPGVVEPAHSALLSALASAAAAYSSLAAAASSSDEGGYAVARGRVQQAEAALDSVLASFSLLGYK